MADGLLDDSGIAISLTIIIFGIALALPAINLGKFGLDFSTFPTSAITVLRIGLIGLGIAIGLKPLQDDREGMM